MRVSRGRDGFTLIEVLIAVGILSVGILALLQTAGSITVMLRDGRLRTAASAVAASRIDNLRLAAAATTPTCASVTSGSATSLHGSESWTVAGTGRSRTVAVTVTVSNGPRQLGMTVRATLLCP
ncbi:MAG TPA: prepilin-type N-terminal cleavage/methylation domain-containing protein [Gemmatimonadales bacterium]|nr:prepilin-type N-terminal cleavage/methylation domain-containing protein [Gemmatimonadales bacterium]